MLVGGVFEINNNYTQHLRQIWMYSNIVSSKGHLDIVKYLYKTCYANVEIKKKIPGPTKQPFCLKYACIYVTKKAS